MHVLGKIKLMNKFQMLGLFFSAKLKTHVLPGAVPSSGLAHRSISLQIATALCVVLTLTAHYPCAFKDFGRKHARPANYST